MNRTVNKTLINELVKNHGKYAIEKVVVNSGVAQTIIRRAMQGHAPDSIASMIELASYLNVSIDELFPKNGNSEEVA